MSKVVKAITASLEFHKQLSLNRQVMQEQLVTKVMAQVQTSLGEQGIEDMCDQIMADIVDDSQRDLCLELTKATISKLVTKMVATHLNHQYSKNVTCKQNEITNGQQDQLVSMVLKAVQATLRLQVMKEMHEQFSRKALEERLKQEESNQISEAVQDRLSAELAEIIQHASEHEAEEVSHVQEVAPAAAAADHSGQKEVTEVVGVVRDALYLQLRTDLCDQLVSAIVEEFVPD